MPASGTRSRSAMLGRLEGLTPKVYIRFCILQPPRVSPIRDTQSVCLGSVLGDRKVPRNFEEEDWYHVGE
jgi:hypothetical protein